MKNLSEVKDQHIKSGLKVHNDRLNRKGEVVVAAPHVETGETHIVTKYDNNTISSDPKSKSGHIKVVEQ